MRESGYPPAYTPTFQGDYYRSSPHPFTRVTHEGTTEYLHGHDFRGQPVYGASPYGQPYHGYNNSEENATAKSAPKSTETKTETKVEAQPQTQHWSRDPKHMPHSPGPYVGYQSESRFHDVVQSGYPPAYTPTFQGQYYRASPHPYTRVTHEGTTEYLHGHDPYGRPVYAASPMYDPYHPAYGNGKAER